MQIHVRIILFQNGRSVFQTKKRYFKILLPLGSKCLIRDIQILFFLKINFCKLIYTESPTLL